MENTTTIPVTDLKVGDVVINFGWLPVSKIEIVGPRVYGVRVHGLSSYVITTNGVDDDTHTWEMESYRHVTIVS